MEIKVPDEKIGTEIICYRHTAIPRIKSQLLVYFIANYLAVRQYIATDSPLRRSPDATKWAFKVLCGPGGF